MAQAKISTILCGLIVAAGLMAVSPGRALAQECLDTPSDAVKSVPSPVRKWAQIGCTQFGQTLGGRDGWVWASLKDAAKVTLVAGRPQHAPDGSAEPSYFTDIHVEELRQEELASALADFHRGLELKTALVKAYRLDLTISSGESARMFFFDFGSFAAGMFCPEDICVTDSRFLIMKQENKDQIMASLDSSHLPSAIF